MAEHQGGQGSQDNTLTWLFVGAGLFLITTIFFGDAIATFFLNIKLWELTIVRAIVPMEINEYEMLYKMILERAPEDWKAGEILKAGGRISLPFAIIFSAILGYYTYKHWKKNPVEKFKRVHSMDSLIESEKVIWPYIAPVIGLNLIKEDLNNGPWAMSSRPYDYVVKYNLLDKEKDLTSLNKMKTEKLFASQLSKMWESPHKLPKPTRALFAIFAAHGCKDKDLARDTLYAIATSAEGGKKPDFTPAEPLFKKYAEDPRVLEIINKHAYVNTVMPAMLEFARSTGVLPTSYFIWLKPINRTLYYTLNCVGRQTTFVEVAGIFSHWKAEKVARHPIEKPYIEPAVDGLEKALLEIKLEE